MIIIQASHRKAEVSVFFGIMSHPRYVRDHLGVLLAPEKNINSTAVVLRATARARKAGSSDNRVITPTSRWTRGGGVLGEPYAVRKGKETHSLFKSPVQMEWPVRESA
jgi:hypothetical protein